jgi:Putative peptidoglycan binding domain
VKFHRDDHLPTIIDRDSRSRKTHYKVVSFCYVMNWLFAITLMAVVPLYAGAPAKSKQASSQSSTKSAKRSHKARSHPSPSYQLHPDPGRYQEIQKALADRGYFKGEVNGVWGDDSIDALKRFQADQKLPDDGKISALSLTGLGLGPKHDGSVMAAPVAAPNPPTNASPPVVSPDPTPKSTSDPSVPRPPGANPP